MALLDDGMLTLADWAKRKDPDGTTSGIVEVLGQSNEILDDMLFMEGNLPTGHRTTIRTGLPKAYWRSINAGVPSSKSQTAQVDETIGMLETYSQVDKDLAMLSGNVSQFRFTEAIAHIEGISQEMASTVFYGNASASPEEFSGLVTRYNTANRSTAQSAQNVVLAQPAIGATANMQTSVWMICWGMKKVSGLFPKGSMAGIQHQDLGERPIAQVSGNQEVVGTYFQGYLDHWQWKMGICVEDWRYAVRIANVEVGKATSDSIINALVRAIHRLPNKGVGKTAIYMNRSVQTLLDLERRNDVKNAGMTYEDVDGKIIPSFRGIPIRTVDALVETEAVVS